MKKISRVLIANRGEIAARIAGTVRRMGLFPIVVYSEADRETTAVREILEGASGEARLIGPAAAASSYLDAERVLRAAADSGADALHPGYGFLSEDSAFARRVLRAGLVWIGPTPEAMDRVSSKSRAKALAASVGVPTLQGESERQDVASFLSAAEKIGFPVMLKASAGGGGRGIRKVASRDELTNQFDLARSEAENSFGNGELLLEKYVERAHHVEVQIFGDDQGDVIQLGERDCSTQRRHQKIIEETPSPAISPALREKIHEAAIAIAKAARYNNAGTIEFLVHGDEFFFLEVNTRLQVEHPITEMVSGLDLVEWQIRIARGELLPRKEVRLQGHAIELRLCAEDPAQSFRPSTGRLAALELPTTARVDHFLTYKSVITPFYDSMIAKIVVHGADRSEAIARAIHALDETFVSGVTTNRDYLRSILTSEPFHSATLTTRDLDENKISVPPVNLVRHAAVVATYLAHSRRSLADSPATLSGWTNGCAHRSLVMIRGERDFKFSIEAKNRRWEVANADARFTIEDPECKLHLFEFSLDGAKRTARLVSSGAALHLSFEGAESRWIDPLSTWGTSTLARDSDIVVAPMDGMLIKIQTELGARVRAGETLAILEAMKMHLELKAPRDGRVRDVLVAAGTQVRNRQPLVKLALET